MDPEALLPEAKLGIQSGGTGFWGAWFTILCCMAGTGILQLPLTIKQGGWCFLALICLVAIMTNYTAKAIIACLHASPDGLRLGNYPDIGRAAYGTPGVVVVQVFHKATLLGVTTIFLILAGKFFLEGIGGGGDGLYHNAFGSSSDEDVAAWQKRWTCIGAAVVLVPMLCVGSVKEVWPLAAFGLFSTFMAVIVVVVSAAVLTPITLERAHDHELPLPDEAQLS